MIMNAFIGLGFAIAKANERFVMMLANLTASWPPWPLLTGIVHELSFQPLKNARHAFSPAV